jgi:hypothetical protein
MAACSNTSNQSAAKDPAYVNSTTTPVSEPAMTPASLERSDPPAATRSLEERRTASAPAVADTKPADPNRMPDGARTEPQAPRADAAVDNTRTASDDSRVAPDNTKVNKRDTNDAALTPMDQSNEKTDLKITQQIRQAVMADGSLSFTAKNVKIITQGGKVTLRGPVKSDQERSNIEAAARKVAGVTQVDNQIEVKK